MSNKLRKLEDELFLYRITGKALNSTCGSENILQVFHIVSTSERTAISKLDEVYWGSDEIHIDNIEKIGNFSGYAKNFIFSNSALKKIKKESENLYIIPKEIKKKLIEDEQFIRYFRSLFSDLYEELKGIEITIPDYADLNNGKDVLYEKVPESRIEFLFYMKSVIDFMIQEEKTEAEENNISLN